MLGVKDFCIFERKCKIINTMRRIISLFILSMATVMLMANPVGREKARANAAQFLSVSKTAKVNNVQMLEKRLQPVEA